MRGLCSPERFWVPRRGRYLTLRQKIPQIWPGYNRNNMEKEADYDTQNSEVDASHCLKCGAYHFENECTAYVQSFYWPYEAGEVCLVGEWSGWRKREPMVKMEDFYVCQVSLTLGTYQYKFIVDGEWVHDGEQPVIINEFQTYNNVKEVIPKRAYLDEYEISDDDDEFVWVNIESSLASNNLRLIGSWDNWTIQRPLHKQFNMLKNSPINCVKIKLQKGNRYEFKFKKGCGEYFTDENYPALENGRGSMNNYLVTSCFMEARTPIAVRNSLKKSNSLQETEWEWEKQDFQGLTSYNLYGHSLTCIGDILYIFGGIYRNEFRDYLIKIPLCELSQYQQEKINIPPRAYHTAVADGTKIIIFGGLNTSVLNDCKIYNTATQEWSESLTMSGALPSSREKSTGVLFKDSIILYGGYYCCPKTETEIIYDDIHIFNTQSMVWTKPQGPIENAPPRFAHSATMNGDEMLVFGGIQSMPDSVDSNVLWKLKIEKDNLKWRYVETSGFPPSPRHGHTANIIMHYLVIFGGADDKQVFNDVKMLELDNMQWITPVISGQIPRSVVYHSAISVSNQLIVIGGKTSAQKYKPSVLILKPKYRRKKSFSILSPNFEDQDENPLFY